MVKVVINDSKGLVQYAGSGVEIESKGAVAVKYGAVQSLNAAGDYDDEFALPAGAVVVDVGVVALTAFQTANNGADELNLKVGLSAGGVELVAETAIVPNNGSVTAGSACSVLANNKIVSGGAAAGFVDGCLLRSPTGVARSVHTRLVVDANALASAGTAQTYVKYVVVK